MQRNRSISRKNPYVKSGIPGHRAPGGRRMGGARRAIRLLCGLAVGLLRGPYGCFCCWQARWRC